jgi:hypothetical protein
MIVDRIWLGDSVEKGFLTYLKEYAKNWREIERLVSSKLGWWNL